MIFRLLTGTLVFVTSGAALFGCNSDDSHAGGQAGTNGSAGTATGGGGAGGGAGAATGGAGAGGGNSDGIVRTSAACGEVPILGDFDMPPDACVTCMNTNCCDEATACGNDPTCIGFRDCAAACGTFDIACRQACGAQYGPGATNSAFNACRADSCADSCFDLSCVDEPFPAPTTATFEATLFIFNFVTRQGVAGATVKVCDGASVDCAAPLETQTTDAGGNVTVHLPSAPKGSTAYLEITGTDLAPQLTYLFNREPEVSLNASVLVLDLGTEAAYGQLAGASAVPDGGTSPFGNVGVQAYGCGGASLPGVTFTSSNGGPDMVVTYMDNGLPTQGTTATDGSGQAAIVDHLPGPTTITMHQGSQTLGSVDVLVRAGFFTTVTIPVGP